MIISMTTPANEFESRDSKRALSLEAPTHIRYHVMGFLCLMAFLLYLTRIGIAQAAPRIKTDLGLDYAETGYFLGAFTLAYGLFQVATGHLGDRLGSRKVLTYAVCLFSLGTLLTGLASGLIMLIAVRFLFGTGSAGAWPNAVKLVTRWFPAQARGPALGMMLMGALIGAGVAPLIMEGLIEKADWRLAFVVLGVPGLLWGAWFYLWFRDDPAEHPAVNEAEHRYIAQGQEKRTSADDHPAIPWAMVLARANVWLLGTISSCTAFTTYLFFSWYPTYLEKGRNLPPGFASRLASFVLIGGAVGSFCGGHLSEWLVRRTGERKWSRRLLGVLSLLSAALAMAVSIHFDEPWLAAGCAAWACLAVHLQLPACWSVVTEVSGPHVGAIWGLINTMGVPGAIGSQLFLGYFVDHLDKLGYVGREQWDPAYHVYAGFLLIGAGCWFFVNPDKRVVPIATCGQDLAGARARTSISSSC
jgi:sugar phosphate permease